MPVNINGTTGVTTPGLDSGSMPTSGGDPVVESGSNSDGEWVRWADGTQHCTTSIDVDWALTSVLTTKPWAQPFTTQPVCGGGPVLISAVSGRVEAFASEYVSGDLIEVGRAHTVARGEVWESFYIGTGRWK